jgi:bifunctional UDP-N-acetylglucosamine pyrophosphorylase / glucosamine-1-phosphate N-acetyltransferase
MTRAGRHVRRTLLVPAAGLGTRLGSSLPKLLTPVAGRPMIDHVLARHAPFCQHAVLVIHPSARAAVERHLSDPPMPVSLAEQAAPTGMLDAILAGRDAALAPRPDRVWITWCDQVAISARSAGELARRDARASAPDAVFPTTTQRPPYIHFERDTGGRLRVVRQSREGDAMPGVGESDAGLFSLSAEAFTDLLPEFSATAAGIGRRTGERNFLPFLAWLAQRADVQTFSIDPMEARGVNTPEDLAALAAYLSRERG